MKTRQNHILYVLNMCTGLKGKGCLDIKIAQSMSIVSIVLFLSLSLSCSRKEKAFNLQT